MIVSIFVNQYFNISLGKYTTILLNLLAGKLTPEFEKCLDCIWIRNIELMDKRCFKKKEHKDKVIVYKDDKEMALLRIHFPYNVVSMEGKMYKCKHTYEQCTAPDWDACFFPHNKVEEQLWNAWKKKCFNPPRTKVPTASIEKLHVSNAYRIILDLNCV